MSGEVRRDSLLQRLFHSGDYQCLIVRSMGRVKLALHQKGIIIYFEILHWQTVPDYRFNNKGQIYKKADSTTFTHQRLFLFY